MVRKSIMYETFDGYQFILKPPSSLESLVDLSMKVNLILELIVIILIK